MLQLVEGCVSQDGDCFLYGARTVYRNLTVGNSGSDGSAGFSVDIYSLDEAESRLSIGREKLIALALLCGCDYKQGGVAGIGRESVLRFLSTHKNVEVLPRQVYAFFHKRNYLNSRLNFFILLKIHNNKLLLFILYLFFSACSHLDFL